MAHDRPWALRAMIVVTAGHIDHGKTALVRALTGTDTDRLPEERARGITIDLGFAFLDAGDAGRIAFVDVPGHEKLVRTMLAGATGGSFALLVVAADEGPRPQTLEHLALLDLLGLRHCAVALTKTDRADAARVAGTAEAVRAMLAPTTLAAAPVLPCSALTGQGVAALAAHLAGAARSGTAQDGATRSGAGEGFRLAVDRAFTLAGVGLVATGTVHAGVVRPGDRVVVSPAGTEARVRAVHADGLAAGEARAGQRCAVNLAGPRLSRDALGRGAWVLDPALHAPTSCLDLRLVLAAGEPALPARGRTVHAHVGTARVSGRVSPLGPADGAGDGRLARLALDAPVGALAGDRVVLRDVGARRTVGGGRVLDPFGPARGAGRPERLRALAASDRPDAAASLSGLLDVQGAVPLAPFRLARNVPAAAEAGLLASCGALAVELDARRAAVGMARWASARDAVLAVLDAHAAARPDSFGLPTADIAAALPQEQRPLVPAALGALTAEGALLRLGRLLRPAGHAVRLAPEDEAAWARLEALLRGAGLDPPRVAQLVDGLGIEEAELRPLLDRLARLGRLRALSRHYYVLPAVLDALAACAWSAGVDGLLTVGPFRAAAGIGRNATLAVLEFFDHVGFTRRVPEGRRLGRPWAAPGQP